MPIWYSSTITKASEFDAPEKRGMCEYGFAHLAQRRIRNVKIHKAPKVNAGDSIELKPLIGKTLAVKITARRDVDTKFGKRPLNEAVLIVEGQKEPLVGVLFQSYFSKLDLHEWYVGKLEKEEMRWNLNSDAVNQKQIKAMETAVAEYEKAEGSSDVPF
jgi:hypothetical protein